MKAVFTKSATGAIKSKIVDPRYGVAELVLQVSISPAEFAKLVTEYDESEFELTITGK